MFSRARSRAENSNLHLRLLRDVLDGKKKRFDRRVRAAKLAADSDFAWMLANATL
jgi:hypothetical protein